LIRRGEVYFVSLDPVVGSEIGKMRPAVVLQNDLANRSSATVTVVPISSQVQRVFPFQVLIPAGEGGLEKPSKGALRADPDGFEEPLGQTVRTASYPSPRRDSSRARPASLVLAG